MTAKHVGHGDTGGAAPEIEIGHQHVGSGCGRHAHRVVGVRALAHHVESMAPQCGGDGEAREGVVLEDECADGGHLC